MPHLFMSQQTKVLRQLIRNTRTEFSSQNPVLNTMYLSQKSVLSFSKCP
jgi:hypothetical protein